jgi:aminoglycoside phosphotransferase (APT) family kinase protein
VTDEQRTRLRDWLAVATGDAALRIAGAAKLSGGAIQQNWALDIETRGEARRWVLRTDSAAVLAVSLPRAAEYALLRAAHDAGVTVPEPLMLCEDRGVIGAPFFVMQRVAGTAQGHRVVKDATLGGGREKLAAQLGRELARIHGIRPPRADLGFLGAPPADAGLAAIAAMRARLDAAGTPRPVTEHHARRIRRHGGAGLGIRRLGRSGGRSRLVLREMLALRQCGAGSRRHRPARGLLCGV